MKENKYDDISFFKEYKKMPRSVNGLKSAGEWHELKKVLPSFTDKRVLDLGCGFGWHCKYAAEHGAKAVVGVDISENMLNEAKRINNSSLIEYTRKPIEDIDYQENSFDVVISSLAFHYIKSFDYICKKVNRCLSKGGDFVFSVEHPIFTAHGNQDWCYDEEKSRLYWPVDNYFIEGIRKSNFLGKDVMKYHKTLTTYINGLLINGFEITNLIEPMPDESMLLCNTKMQDELRRPMMLIISARKKD